MMAIWYKLLELPLLSWSGINKSKVFKINIPKTTKIIVKIIAWITLLFALKISITSGINSNNINDIITPKPKEVEKSIIREAEYEELDDIDTKTLKKAISEETNTSQD